MVDLISGGVGVCVHKRVVGVKEQERELAQTLVQHLVVLIALDYGTNLKIVIIIIVQFMGNLVIGHNGLIAVQLVDRVFNKGRGLVIIQNQLMAAEHALVVRMNELIVKFKTVL